MKQSVFVFTMLAACSSVLLAADFAQDAVSAEDVHQMQSRKADLILLDARSSKSYEAEHIEGARLPLEPDYYQMQALFQANVTPSPPNVDDFLKRSMEPTPRGTKIITYCHKGCQASEVLMVKLRELGFTDVKFMRDGLDAWKEKGYPVVSKV